MSYMVWSQCGINSGSCPEGPLPREGWTKPAVSDRSGTPGPEADPSKASGSRCNPPTPTGGPTHLGTLDLPEAPPGVCQCPLPQVAGVILRAVPAKKGLPAPRQAPDPPSQRRTLWKPLEIETLPVRLPYPSYLIQHGVQGGGPRRLGPSLQPPGLGQESRAPPPAPWLPVSLALEAN